MQLYPQKAFHCSFPFTGKPERLLTFQVFQRFNQTENILHSKPWVKNVLPCPAHAHVKFCALNDGKIPKKTPVYEICLLCVQRNHCCYQYWKFSCRKIIPEVVRTFRILPFQENFIVLPLEMTLKLEETSFNSVS